MVNTQPDVLQELRRAARRREELAEAYAKKAAKLRTEAGEMRQVASRIERKVGGGSGEPAPSAGGGA